MLEWACLMGECFYECPSAPLGVNAGMDMFLWLRHFWGAGVGYQKYGIFLESTCAIQTLLA